MISFNYITGHPSQVLSSINCRIGQIKRYFPKMKIGITNNPERRFKEHGGSARWKEMRLLYRTSSPSYIRWLESFLIQSNKGRILNKTSGGDGYLTSGPFFLYVLIPN